MPATTEMMTTDEVSAKLGVSSYYIRQLCREHGESFGARKYGPIWVIPSDRLADIPVRECGRPAKGRTS